MQKEKLTIGFDYDDTLFPFTQPFLDYHNNIHGTKFTLEDVTCYGFSKCLGIPHDNLKKSMKDFCESDSFKNILPYDDAVQGIEKISREGHELYIVSNRRKELQNFVEGEVRKYFPNKFSGIYLTDHASSRGAVFSKAQVANDFGLDIFVEDCIEMAEQIAQSGKSVILLEQPWNVHRKITPEFKNNIYHVNSWEGIVKKINEMSYEKFMETTHK